MKLRINWRDQHSARRTWFFWAEFFFFSLGLQALALCALAYFEARLFQAHEEELFENALRAPDIVPDHGILRQRGEALRRSAQNGSPVSRMEIPRVGISVMVVEGIRPNDLKIAVGHIPGSAFPEESGNVAIAGHRDTYFRNLRELRTNDLITLTTLSGTYQYSVEWTRVVSPRDVNSLRPSAEPVLTLVTCYPFYYVGPAPRRFIVRARQVGRTG